MENKKLISSIITALQDEITRRYNIVYKRMLNGKYKDLQAYISACQTCMDENVHFCQGADKALEQIVVDVTTYADLYARLDRINIEAFNTAVSKYNKIKK